MSAKPHWAPENSEEVVRQFLAERDLRAEKIPTAEGKRPDFEVFKGDTMEFYCEVKALTDADPLANHFVEKSPGIHVAEQFKIGDRSRQYRIAKNIHTAAKQFDAINPDLSYPNVLAFVNWDDLCPLVDLRDLLVGCIDKVNGVRVTFAPAAAHQQIANDRGRIHAFIWIDLVPKEKPFHIYYWDRPCPFTERLKHFLDVSQPHGHEE